MTAIDTNVLIHAHRENMEKHNAAVEKLRILSEGLQPWALPVFCIGEFLRVVTHPRVFTPPSTLADALSAIGGLLESPSIQVLTPGEHFWSFFSNTLQQGQATGNLIFDAQIIAVCVEHGVETVISEDRGLKRFDQLTIVPL